MQLNPGIIKGESFTDERGTIRYANDFYMQEIKRMYVIEHPDSSVIRAWQGHRKEQKWFFVVEGGFEIHLVLPDNWSNPSQNLPVISYNLFAENNEVLHIPGGYANGIRALKDNSKLLVYSDFDIKTAAEDNYKFDKNFWYKWA
ncbi:MAG TPA: hypothetical protein PKE30_02120 [Niabella sp.]|nr:hypothetical protein [Niabella sp.]